MDINSTMLGQTISFVLFVLFCMKFVWPPITQIMRERQVALAEGLSKAAAAEKQLEAANTAAELELDEAKKQSAELLAQARDRASQIIEEAKIQATEEANRIKTGAQAEIDQEVNRARESLRSQVTVLAVAGAEKILEIAVDKNVHQRMLDKIASQL